MEKLLTDLAVAAPSAVAVIVVVVLFLRHLRAERESRDTAQGKFLDCLSSLSAPIRELVSEVKSLRDCAETIKNHSP